jgi:hypothetical protein
VNRRDLLKKVSIVVASSVAPAFVQGQTKQPATQSGKKPIPKRTAATAGISVFFHGLWGFWIGAPDASGRIGVLAFTPDAGHTLVAGLSNVGAAGELAAGNYLVDAASTQTNPLAVITAILKYPSGFFFDNRTTTDPVKVDLSGAWASVWLPLPDTIVPAYGVQITPQCEPFQGNDVAKYRIGTMYPTSQQFVYGTANQAALSSTGSGGALLSTTSDQPELQFATLPQLGSGSTLGHESSAFGKLMGMLKRNSGSIDIKVVQPIGDCSPATIALKRADRMEFGRRKPFSVPPANCAGGDGCLVGP